ncbi:DegV family protein [Zhihengliuella flava]|uniref:DegV family protein with EDD domain n=1 Tax=Zhihengliuella flava TaxID=1285193 RepID=A0A931GKB1_9MICC|nr:DegV family protein [Zhihengliuella flava]MBG6083344.1 DegV family protein with EDD domain [Zhihengliuella flava]
MATRGRPGRGWLDRIRRRASSETADGPQPPIRPRVAVVTDSAASLRASDIERWASVVRVVPMPVMIDGQIFTEGHDDAAAALAHGLAAAVRISTSRPAPGVFARCYRDLLAEGFEAVVSIHLSGELSGTAEAARAAAREVDGEVRVVDTRTVGMAEGFAVLDAAEAASSGLAAEEVEAAARRGEAGMINFVLPTLEQLRRGGRITLAASVLGTLLSVKPILTLNHGRIEIREKARSTSRAVDRLVELSRQRALECERETGRKPRVAIHSYGSGEVGQELAHELAAFAREEVVLVDLPAVLAAHTGAGVVAVVVR